MEPPMRPTAGAPPPTDAILTVPNLLTLGRLLLIPLFLWLGLGPDRMDLAVAVALLGFATDLIDGPIARRYGQVSKLGIAFDPVSDRLGLAAGAVVIVAQDLAPLWAVLLVVVRDAALVLIGAPILRARGAQIPPVSRMGKRASFGVSLTFALFLAAGIPDVADPVDGVRAAAWALFAVSVPLYYAATVGYARAGMRALRGRG